MNAEDRVTVKMHKKYEPNNPVFVVTCVNEDEPDTVLAVFSEYTEAYDYAIAEAEMNDLDIYRVIERELI